MQIIQYNAMIDLLVSASTYVQDLRQAEDEIDQPNCEAQRKKWEILFDKELTLFVRQDTKLFFKNMAFVIFLIRLAAHQDHLIDYLRTIDRETMLFELNAHYSTDLNPKSSIEKIQSTLRDALTDKSIDTIEDTLQIYMEILRSPQEVLTRIANALEILFPLFCQYFLSETAYQEIDAELAICNKQLQETPEDFVKQVTLVNYSDQTKVLPDFKYFILYGACEEVIFLHSVHILLFGISVRTHVEKEARRVDLQAFIKLISDPTRYDILKLLNKQKWYGNELAKHFNLTPATISHHLNKFIVLRLIRAESGPQNKIYFELDIDELKRILKDIERDLLS